MWYNILQNNSFLKKLYNKVPELSNIRISEINIQNEENKISIIFYLPYYADTPPQEWVDAEYNTVFVQVDFLVIHNLYIESANNCPFIGHAKINLDKNKLINIDIIGTLKAKIKAEIGLIRCVNAYLNDPWSEEA